MNKELEDLLDKIKKFRDERDWQQFHNHKDMAISIVLEAAELLEHFQWKNKEQIDEHVIKEKEKIEEEIADILIYMLEMSDSLGIDIVEAVEKKIGKNAKKYPVEKVKGSNKKYTEL